MKDAFLVVNADDLGVSKGATSGIVRAHKEGIVTSASLCCTTTSYRHALDSCVRECPELGVGLHVSLTLGSPAAGSRVPLLMDGSGRFAWSFTSLFFAAGIQRRADLLSQIAIEVDAQFERLERDGVKPDHVDGERHVHLIPGIFEIVAEKAKARGVPFIRAGQDAGIAFATNLVAILANGGAVKSILLSQLGRRARSDATAGLRSPDYVASYLYTGRTDVFLPRLLDLKMPGITEVMVHPGEPEKNGTLDLGVAEVERYLMSQDRRLELDACIAARRHTGAWKLTTFGAIARAA